MKKILWMMVLLPIFMSRVWASDVYYSDYGCFSDYQEEYIDSSDIINVESVTMYKWYKNIKVPGEFKLYNSNDNFLDNCYYTDYSTWSNIKPIITEATILEEKTIYNYEMIEKVRYIHLYDLQGSYGAFRIPELQVFVNDEEIDYDYTCNGCWENFDEYIHNGIYIENSSYVDNGGNLILDLGTYYPINKIKLLFYVFDMGDTTKKFTLGYSLDKENIFISKSFEHRFSSPYLKDSLKFEYLITDLDISQDLWIYEYTSEEYINNEYVYSKNSYQQYRYKDKMCQTYTLQKDYYPQYSSTQVDDYIYKDNEKTFYRYQKRDKLELNIYNITEQYYDLNNFVISSTDDYTIENNINWSLNGKYNVTFTLNDLVVEDSVNVNIFENALIEKENEIDKLEEQLKNTISDYETIIETLEKSNLEYLNSINNLTEEIVAINNKIIELETTDSNTLEMLEELKEKLNEHIEKSDAYVEKLEQNNRIYLENLNVFSNTMHLFEERIKSIEENQNGDIEKLKKLNETIQNHLNEYQQKISSLEIFKSECLQKLEKINFDIESINQILNTLEIKNDELENKVENIENKLEELDNIKNEIIKLQQYDQINEECLNLLKERLEQQLDYYDIKINELDNKNNNYLQQLTSLNDAINSLYKKIDILQDSDADNIKNINSLKEELKNNVNIYNQKLQEVQTFNKTYSDNLNNINLKIIDLKDLIEQTEIFNENKYEELKANLLNLSNKIEKFENSNLSILKEYENINNTILQLQNKIENIEINNNENIIDLKKKIEEYAQTLISLKQDNHDYVSQINKLNDEIVVLNDKILDLELYISENYEKEIEKIKSNLMQVSQTLDQKEDDDLNSKLNNFILKINGVEKINLLWFYILISFIFVGYVVYLFRKKSNKKNS